MRLTLTTFSLLAFITIVGVLPAAAWGEAGHKITAYIAWQRMTPDVREAVIKILREAPEDSMISAYYPSYGSQSEEVRKRDFFMLMSTWADMIKDRDLKVRFNKYSKSNWHYDDKFWTVRDGKIEYLPAPEDGGQALARLIEFDQVIRGRATDAQKAIAIAWINHLVGDLHQPLHTSARVTETEPKGDQGGNLVLLTPKGTKRAEQLNLHSYWDGIVGRVYPNNRGECDSAYVEPLAREIMKRHTYAKFSSRLAPGKFADWVAESLNLAQTVTYSPDLKRFEMPSEKYQKRALNTAQERLATAGYRMGDLFNSAFTVQTVPSISP